MVAVEAVLCNRPVLASMVVPAAEIMPQAIVRCAVDDPESFVFAIRRARDDSKVYHNLLRACGLYREPFLDGRMGLEPVLGQALLGKAAPALPQK
jgi:hypothetical protein